VGSLFLSERASLSRYRSISQNIHPHSPLFLHAGVQVCYTVDRVPESHGPEPWPHQVGHVTADMIQRHLPAPQDDSCILLCGPPPM
jgi:NAD(P)H-flavin reductase